MRANREPSSDRASPNDRWSSNERCESEPSKDISPATSASLRAHVESLVLIEWLESLPPLADGGEPRSPPPPTPAAGEVGFPNWYRTCTSGHSVGRSCNLADHAPNLASPVAVLRRVTKMAFISGNQTPVPQGSSSPAAAMSAYVVGGCPKLAGGLPPESGRPAPLGRPAEPCRQAEHSVRYCCGRTTWPRK